MSFVQRSFSTLTVFSGLLCGSPAQAVDAPESIVPIEVQIEKPSLSQKISPNIRHAATSLGMDESLADQSSAALHLIYKRDYKAARQAFSTLHSQHPELAIGNVGRMLIFQCLMLENFDYRFERQYESHAALALREMKRGSIF
jgi:hypothetical protein